MGIDHLGQVNKLAVDVGDMRSQVNFAGYKITRRVPEIRMKNGPLIWSLG